MEARGEHLLAELSEAGDERAVVDFGESDLKDIRDYLNGSLYAFAIFICNFKDLIPSLHRPLANWIENWGMCQRADGKWVYYGQVNSHDTLVRDYRRIMTQIPREHFKTSLGTIANSLWQASRIDPDGVVGVHRPVAIFNERQDNAVRWLRAVRDIIQSSLLYQVVYKDLVPPGIARGDNRSMPRYWRWNDSGIDLNGKRVGEVEASISAHGVEGATTGSHWPKIILDDLISIKHQQSALEMEGARAWIRKHVYLMRPAEGSLAYVNCTPYTYTDIYVDLCKDFKYKLYRRSALEDASGKPSIAGEPIFPQKLSKATLLDAYKRNAFEFLSQMQCLPTPGEHQSFNTDWLRFGKVVTDTPEGEPAFLINQPHYDPTIKAETTGEEAPPRLVPLHQLAKAIILDPAPTEKTELRQDPHARNAILVEGIDCHGRRFILEAWADRVGYEAVIAKCFELSRKWGCERLFVEEVNFSNVYRHWIAREQRPDGKFPDQYLAVMPLKPNKRDKHTRILAREPSWRQGLYYLNEEGTLPFQVEYTEYPNSSTVDLLDCMGYDTDCLTRPESLGERYARRREERKGGPYADPYFKPLEAY